MNAAVGRDRIVWSDDRSGKRNVYENQLNLRAQTVAEMYKPELFIAADDYVPMKVDFMTDTVSILRNNSGFSLGAVGIIPNLYEYSGGYYLDLFGDWDNGDEHKSHYSFYRRGPWRIIYPSTMYSVVHDVGEGAERKSVIQYWFCYYYNDYWAYGDVTEHEGDWELVQVELNSGLQPDRVVNSQHDGGKWRGWAYVWGSDSHPQVFVGKGSHANFFQPDGNLPEIVPGPSDSLTPEQPPLLQPLDVSQYSWLDYDGFWGQDVWPGDYFDGPRGPKFNILQQWNDPLNWGGKIVRDGEDEKDSTSVFIIASTPAGSPAPQTNASTSMAAQSLTAETGLLVSLYDAQNRRTGKAADGTVYEEIPQSEYLEWSDGSGSAVVHGKDIGSGYTVEVENTGTNTFNCTLNLPQFTQSLVDKPVYDVTTLGPLKGRVAVAPSGSPQDFTMYLDTDLDGQFDDGSVVPINTVEVVDFTPPGQVNNLSVSNTGLGSATLSWTAPGDNDMSGQASEYEIRYSASAIVDEYGWSQAELVFDEPTPQTAGGSEIFTIEGLPSGNYFFALRSTDDQGLLSSISVNAQADVPAYHFEDDFSDSNAYGWTEQNPALWSIINVSGDNKYRANTTAGPTASWTGPGALRDQAFEAEITIMSGTTAGIIIRSTGDDESFDDRFYYFGLYPQEGRWKLFSVSSGWWGDNSHNPQAEGGYPISYSTPYTIKAEALEENISLSIDGLPLPGGIQVNSNHGWGRFGVRADGGEAWFDNLIADQAN